MKKQISRLISNGLSHLRLRFLSLHAITVIFMRQPNVAGCINKQSPPVKSREEWWTESALHRSVCAFRVKRKLLHAFWLIVYRLIYLLFFFLPSSLSLSLSLDLSPFPLLQLWMVKSNTTTWWGCSSVGRASGQHAADAGSIPRCGERFSFESQLSVQTLSRCPRTLCAVACINICAHVKDPVVHVRVR